MSNVGYSLSNYFKDLYDELSRDLGDRNLGPLFQIRSENWPLTLKVSSEDFDMTRWAIFVLAGLIYGGLHALAWNACFSSELEKPMWRMSAMSPGLIGLLIIVSKNKIAQWEEKTRMEPDWESTRSVMLWVGTLLMVILPCVGTGLFSAYIFARAYLVMECFISLAHSPPGIYDLPQWPTYLPHIT